MPTRKYPARHAMTTVSTAPMTLDACGIHAGIRAERRVVSDFTS